MGWTTGWALRTQTNIIFPFARGVALHIGNVRGHRIENYPGGRLDEDRRASLLSGRPALGGAVGAERRVGGKAWGFMGLGLRAYSDCRKRFLSASNGAPLPKTSERTHQTRADPSREAGGAPERGPSRVWGASAGRPARGGGR